MTAQDWRVSPDPFADAEPDKIARLIAAAPDLLMACETVVACIDQGVVVDREALNGLAMSRLLAAISKAAGSAA